MQGARPAEIRAFNIMASGIYKITNTANGKFYIGSAVNFKSRWKNHRATLINGQHHNPILLRAWNKYGAEAFEFSVVEVVEDHTLLVAREQHHIDTLNPFFNILPTAGSCLGRRFSKATRLKMSEIAKKRPAPSEEVRARIAATLTGRKLSAETIAKRTATMQANAQNRPRKLISEETRQRMSEAGKNRPDLEKMRYYGSLRKNHVVTEETRRKISEAHTGKKLTPEHIEKMAATKRGVKTGPRSEETRRKISEANKGRKLSSEQCAAISERMRGTKRGPHSEETRRKMSEANKGQKRTEEAKKRMSEAQKRKELTPKQLEHLRKMSAANVGRVKSEEERRNISEGHRAAKAKAAKIQPSSDA